MFPRSAVLILLFLPAALFGQQFREGPKVGPEQIRNGRLWLPDLKCSVDSPGPDWDWLHAAAENRRGSHYFVAMRGTFLSFGLFVWPVREKVGEEFALNLKRQTGEFAERTGRKLKSFDYSFSDAPRPKSLRYSHLISAPEDEDNLTFGYVIPCGGKLLNLQYQGARREEPQAFTKIANSVREEAP